MTEVERVNRRRKNRRLILERSIEPKQLEPIIGYAQEPLLSLIDTCRPLLHTIDNILNYAAIAMNTTSKKPADGLTRDESAAIRLYTMEWDDDRNSLYFILNRTLRAGDRNELKPWFQYLKLFLTALVKVPCARSQTVWRGLRQNVSDRFPPGTEVTWWSFSSCTTMLTVLESELYLGQSGERTLFSIEIINGRDISAHSHFENEDEVLLLPGTYMEVRSQLNPTTDMHIIHLRQTVPQKMLLEPPFEDAPLYPNSGYGNANSPFAAFWNSCFHRSSKRHWYCRKKFFIAISIISILCILGVVLGSVFGTRSSTKISEILPPSQTIGVCANARWNQSGITVAGGNGPGQDLDQFDSPDGIFVKEDGTVYVADGNNNRIIRWNSERSHGAVVAGGHGYGNSSNQLNFPVDLIVDPNGTLYISDFTNKRIQKWQQGASDGQTIFFNLKFTGLEQDDEGSLYTSDWTNNTVRKWQTNDTVGQILVTGFIQPDRIFIDKNRSIYVVDRSNHSVIKIDQVTGNISVVAGGRRGQSMSSLDLPRGVTVDELGNVYVADTNNHRIVRWSPGATFGVLIVGGRDRGSKADQLYEPTDLQFDQYGNLYVADSGNDRIQKFMIDKSRC